MSRSRAAPGEDPAAASGEPPEPGSAAFALSLAAAAAWPLSFALGTLAGGPGLASFIRLGFASPCSVASESSRIPPGRSTRARAPSARRWFSQVRRLISTRTQTTLSKLHSASSSSRTLPTANSTEPWSSPSIFARRSRARSIIAGT